jgi:squalene synthase HpnC
MSALSPPRPDPDAVLAQARSENFPVASHLFPRALRPHLLNIYGFARMTDDLGDEAAGDRLAQLDWLSGELDELFAGGTVTHPLLVRLALTVSRYDLPREPFDRLIAANRQDQVVKRYATFDRLRDYCHASADPVGELVLRLVGRCSDELLVLSSATCTALQLVEFLQDLGEDAAMGRIYVPLADLARFDYGEAELLGGVADDRFRAVMAFEAGRARSLFEQGRPLSRLLSGRVGLAVSLFTAGGLAALGDLRRRGYDTLSGSAHVPKGRLAWAAARELSGTAGARLARRGARVP